MAMRIQAQQVKNGKVHLTITGEGSALCGLPLDKDDERVKCAPTCANCIKAAKKLCRELCEHLDKCSL